MVVHFNRLKLCPTNVRSSSYCPQDASHCGQLDGAAGSPVGTETCSSGGQILLIPDDDDERIIGSSVLAAESTSITDDGDTSPTETTDSTSPTETTDSTSPTETTDSTSPIVTTESTSITESAPTTEETPVTDQMPFGMQSSTTRYPSREHRPPSRYDDYIRV